MMASMVAADGGEPPKRTLMEEVEEALAQSMLVFLLADLRLLSATGRVETKYETIAIASDPPTRCTAADLAGLDPDNENVAIVHNQAEGLSPAQIMAVVLLELTYTVQSRRKREQSSPKAGGSVNESDDAVDDAYVSWEHDKKTDTLKLRAGNEDMHSLLKAYSDIIGRDLKTQAPHVEKRYSMLNLNPKHAYVSSIIEEEEEEDLEDEEEEEGEESRRMGQAAVDAGQAAVDAVRKGAEGTKEKGMKQFGRANQKRRSLMRGKEAKDNEQFEDLTNALYRQGVGNRNLRTSLAQSMGTQHRSFTNEELHLFVQKAVDSRVYGKLDFLGELFKDGTVSKFMAESPSRIVWMNDWYPLKDLTYCIAVNPDMKRVLVVFRGAITTEDWSRAVESRNFLEVPNPINEDYEGKTDLINVCQGFYQYLFRTRKDTGTKKYDEIANLAYKFAKERIGDDFTLVVNGHSLGGALSTLFSFYASADDRFTANGPVKCFNFGAPYVGGKRFMLAFQHQEQQQMLMYARFFDHNDIVAHLPPNMQVTKDGGKFRPVGIGVRIPNVPYGLLGRIRGWHPNVFYVKNEGFLRSYRRAIRDNFIFKFPLPPWRFAQMHTLEELQNRLMYGKLVGAGGDFELLQKPIEDVYDILVGTSYGQDVATKGQLKEES